MPNYLCARVPNVFDLLINEMEIAGHMMCSTAMMDLLSHYLLFEDLVELVLMMVIKVIN